MPDTKLKDFMGWEIYVSDTTGAFIAIKAGDKSYGNRKNRLQRTSLRALESEIAKRSKGRVEIMTFVSRVSLPASAPQKIVLVGEDADGRFRTEQGDLYDIYRDTVFYDQSIVDKVREFINRERAVIAQIESEYQEWFQSIAPNLISVSKASVQQMLHQQAKAAREEEGEGEE